LAHGALLCRDCEAALPPPPSPRCEDCGATLPSSALDLCRRCGTHARGFLLARSLGPYDSGWGRLVRLLKFDREPAVARFLGSRLAELARGEARIADAEVVTYVPMTRGERRRRGANPSRQLAATTSRALGVPLRPLLRKRRRTPRQTGLPADARRRNVAGAFVAPRRGSEKVLLIDDIYTTGATADACGGALRNAGHEAVVVLTAARTPSRQ
jgi:predicted amidophosphoribosyltransferase